MRYVGYLLSLFVLVGCLENGTQASATPDEARNLVTSSSTSLPKQPPPDSDRYQGGGG